MVKDKNTDDLARIAADAALRHQRSVDARLGQVEHLAAAVKAQETNKAISRIVDQAKSIQLSGAAQQAIDSRGLAVFMFHGVGGDHHANVEREAHRELLRWLAANRDCVWTETFLGVMEHVAAERKRLGWDATPADDAEGR